MVKFHKVRIIRQVKREGLISARMRGAVAAKGPVLTFLDSHVECTEGWLQPLLHRIALNSHNVVCPVIDNISEKTFEYHFQRDPNTHQIGGFSWKLRFIWIPASEKERNRKKHPLEATRSPTSKVTYLIVHFNFISKTNLYSVAGGLFAIDKALFQKLGMYDPGKRCRFSWLTVFLVTTCYIFSYFRF